MNEHTHAQFTANLSHSGEKPRRSRGCRGGAGRKKKPQSQPQGTPPQARANSYAKITQQPPPVSGPPPNAAKARKENSRGSFRGAKRREGPSKPPPSKFMLPLAVFLEAKKSVADPECPDARGMNFDPATRRTDKLTAAVTKTPDLARMIRPGVPGAEGYAFNFRSNDGYEKLNGESGFKPFTAEDKERRFKLRPIIKNVLNTIANGAIMPNKEKMERAALDFRDGAAIKGLVRCAHAGSIERDALDLMRNPEASRGVPVKGAMYTTAQHQMFLNLLLFATLEDVTHALSVPGENAADPHALRHVFVKIVAKYLALKRTNGTREQEFEPYAEALGVQGLSIEGLESHPRANVVKELAKRVLSSQEIVGPAAVVNAIVRAGRGIYPELACDTPQDRMVLFTLVVTAAVALTPLLPTVLVCLQAETGSGKSTAVIHEMCSINIRNDVDMVMALPSQAQIAGAREDGITGQGRDAFYAPPLFGSNIAAGGGGHQAGLDASARFTTPASAQKGMGGAADKKTRIVIIDELTRDNCRGSNDTTKRLAPPDVCIGMTATPPSGSLRLRLAVDLPPALARTPSAFAVVPTGKSPLNPGKRRTVPRIPDAESNVCEVTMAAVAWWAWFVEICVQRALTTEGPKPVSNDARLQVLACAMSLMAHMAAMRRKNDEGFSLVLPVKGWPGLVADMQKVLAKFPRLRPAFAFVLGARLAQTFPHAAPQSFAQRMRSRLACAASACASGELADKIVDALENDRWDKSCLDEMLERVDDRKRGVVLWAFADLRELRRNSAAAADRRVAAEGLAALAADSKADLTPAEHRALAAAFKLDPPAVLVISTPDAGLNLSRYLGPSFDIWDLCIGLCPLFMEPTSVRDMIQTIGRQGRSGTGGRDQVLLFVSEAALEAVETRFSVPAHADAQIGRLTMGFGDVNPEQLANTPEEVTDTLDPLRRAAAELLLRVTREALAPGTRLSALIRAVLDNIHQHRLPGLKALTEFVGKVAGELNHFCVPLGDERIITQAAQRASNVVTRTVLTRTLGTLAGRQINVSKLPNLDRLQPAVAAFVKGYLSTAAGVVGPGRPATTAFVEPKARVQELFRRALTQPDGRIPMEVLLAHFADDLVGHREGHRTAAKLMGSCLWSGMFPQGGNLLLTYLAVVTRSAGSLRSLARCKDRKIALGRILRAMGVYELRAADGRSLVDGSAASSIYGLIRGRNPDTLLGHAHTGVMELFGSMFPAKDVPQTAGLLAQDSDAAAIVRQLVHGLVGPGEPLPIVASTATEEALRGGSVKYGKPYLAIQQFHDRLKGNAASADRFLLRVAISTVAAVMKAKVIDRLFAAKIREAFPQIEETDGFKQLIDYESPLAALAQSQVLMRLMAALHPAKSQTALRRQCEVAAKVMQCSMRTAEIVDWLANGSRIDMFCEAFDVAPDEIGAALKRLGAAATDILHLPYVEFVGKLPDVSDEQAAADAAELTRMRSMIEEETEPFEEFPPWEYQPSAQPGPALAGAWANSGAEAVRDAEVAKQLLIADAEKALQVETVAAGNGRKMTVLSKKNFEAMAARKQHDEARAAKEVAQRAQDEADASDLRDALHTEVALMLAFLAVKPKGVCETDTRHHQAVYEQVSGFICGAPHELPREIVRQCKDGAFVWQRPRIGRAAAKIVEQLLPSISEDKTLVITEVPFHDVWLCAMVDREVCEKFPNLEKAGNSRGQFPSELGWTMGPPEEEDEEEEEEEEDFPWNTSDPVEVPSCGRIAGRLPLCGDGRFEYCY
jgi:hypothetical protein